MAKSERPRFVRFSRLRLLSTGSSPKAGLWTASLSESWSISRAFEALPLPERGLGASCALALPDLAVAWQDYVLSASAQVKLISKVEVSLAFRAAAALINKRPDLFESFPALAALFRYLHI